MEHTIFLERYRICTNDDGSRQELGRSGAAINYRAVDTRSNEPITLQLVPLASIEQSKRAQFQERARTAQQIDHVNVARVLAVGMEHDYFVLASEHVDGETADSWLVARGPLPADAVMRVGLQLVRATAAAAFYGLTHRAVQPSNLMIVPGQAPDGGWPFVKLLNFGLAGLELHSGSAEAREIAPSVAPAFGSPEQLLNRQIDFRSEIYSIGATMCFLLTGAVPIAVGAAKARFGARRLPELRGAPRSMRRLLVQMLRENPENRPQDPVVFEQEMRRCLTKIERRQAIGHRLGIPLAAVIAHRPKPKKEAPTPLAQVLRGILAGVALLMAATVLGGYFFPHVLPLTRRSEQIGVPIGVPEERATPAAQIVASNPGIIPPPPPTAANQNPPLVENQSQPPAPEAQPPTAPDSPTVADSSSITSGQTNAMAERLEPMPPAKGPDTQSDPEENSAQGRATTSTESSESNALSKKETSASKLSREPTRKHARVAKTLPRGENPYRPQSRGRWVRARWVGTTPDGRAILRLPSGRVVVASRRSDNNGMFPPPARRRILTDRPDFYGPPPETQYPPGYPPYD